MFMNNKDIEIVLADTVIPIEGPSFFDGGIAIQNGNILTIDTSKELLARYPQARTHSYPQCTLMPGLVLPHTSLDFSGLSRSLHTALHPLVGKPDFLTWFLALAESKAGLNIKNISTHFEKSLHSCMAQGITSLGLATILDEINFSSQTNQIRLVLFPEIFNIYQLNPMGDFERSLSLIEKITELNNENLQVGIAPFAAFNLSKNLLRIIRQHSEQQNIPIHIHSSMDFSEMEFFHNSTGTIPQILFPEAGWKEIPPPHHMTPIQYLKEIDFLNEHVSLIGCLHLGATDLALLEQTKTKLILSPSNFAKLGLGNIPWQKIIESKLTWALSPLGMDWGKDINIWDELRLTYQQIKQYDFPASKLLEHVTIDAAKCIQLDHAVGSLKPNKKADFIIVKQNLKNLNQPELSLIEKTTAQDILAIWINGIPLS